MDEAAGQLRYRDYPGEQVAERSSFCDVAYLLIHGDLPSPRHFEIWQEAITRHTLLHDGMSRFFEAFPRDADPMAILSSATTALATFYPALLDPRGPAAIEQGSIRLLARLPTVAAFAYRRTAGLPYAHSGIALRALGFPTVLFALGRLPGWIAQWREMVEVPGTRIGCPAQVYVGHPRRDYPALGAPSP
jgi:citrate synthase